MSAQLKSLLEDAACREFRDSLAKLGVVRPHDVLELHVSDLEEAGMSRLQVRRVQRKARELIGPSGSGMQDEARSNAGDESAKRSSVESDEVVFEPKSIADKKHRKLKHSDKENDKKKDKKMKRYKKSKNNHDEDEACEDIRAVSNASDESARTGRDDMAEGKSKKHGRKQDRSHRKPKREVHSDRDRAEESESCRTRERQRRGKKHRRRDHKVKHKKRGNGHDQQVSSGRSVSIHSRRDVKEKLRKARKHRHGSSSRSSPSRADKQDGQHIEQKTDAVHSMLEQFNNSQGAVAHASGWPHRFDAANFKVLQTMAKECWRYGPARTPSILQSAVLQKKDVRDLRNTHKEISQVFRHGPHNGESVTDLTEKLLRGSVRVRDITPMVVFDNPSWAWRSARESPCSSWHGQSALAQAPYPRKALR